MSTLKKTYLQCFWESNNSYKCFLISESRFNEFKVPLSDFKAFEKCILSQFYKKVGNKPYPWPICT